MPEVLELVSSWTQGTMTHSQVRMLNNYFLLLSLRGSKNEIDRVKPQPKKSKENRLLLTRGLTRFPNFPVSQSLEDHRRASQKPEAKPPTAVRKGVGRGPDPQRWRAQPQCSSRAPRPRGEGRRDEQRRAGQTDVGAGVQSEAARLWVPRGGLDVISFRRSPVLPGCGHFEPVFG